MNEQTVNDLHQLSFVSMRSRGQFKLLYWQPQSSATVNVVQVQTVLDGDTSVRQLQTKTSTYNMYLNHEVINMKKATNVCFGTENFLR